MFGGVGLALAGLILGYIGTLGMTTLLVAIAIPNFIKARQFSQKAACVANLKTIDGAKATWALETRKTNTDTNVPTDADLFGMTSYIREKPDCPANGIYSINQVNAKPTCTIADHTF